MIPEGQLQSIAFPWLLIDHDKNVVSYGDGSLIRPSIAGYSREVISHAINAPEGFSCDPFGYACFKASTPTYIGAFIVLYGLKIVGVSHRSTEPNTYNERFRRDDIRKYVNCVIAQIENNIRITAALIGASMHDIRTMNREIGEIAETLKAPNLFFTNQNDVERGAKDLTAISQILAAAIGNFEYTLDPRVLNLPPQKMNIFGKFDKMRHLADRKLKSGGRVRLQGDGTPCLARVPAIFEIVPYILMQNATKYAPPASDIHVDVRQKDDYISVILSKLPLQNPQVGRIPAVDAGGGAA